MRRKRGSGLLSTKCAVVTLLASVLCLIVIWSSLVYIYVAVSWDGIVQTWMAGSDQVLSVKDIVKEVGGLHLSESCFLPKATLKENLCAPQFIIAGTMKGGTTSLYTYLLNHPLVLPLENSSVNMTKGKDGKIIKISAMGDKEIRFFNSAVYRSISQQYSANNIVKGYMNFFPNISANSADEYSYMSGYITGEASPTYLAESGVATKIKNLFPAMKIIFLLRDPIDRAYSEYWFRQSYIVRSEREKFKFNSLGYSDEDIFLNCMEQDFQIMSYCGMDKWKISKTWLGSPEEICYRKTSKTMQSEQTNPPENNPVICGNATSPLSTYCLTKEFFGYCNQHSAMLGAYAVQLREWFDVFPDSLIKVIRSEDLYNDPIPVLKDVEKFLNIDRVDMNWSEITKNVYNMASPISLSGKDSQVVSSSSGGFVVAQASESSDYPPLSPSSRNYLTNKFKNYNKSLGSIIYQKFRLSWPSGKNQWNRVIQAQE